MDYTFFLAAGSLFGQKIAFCTGVGAPVSPLCDLWMPAFAKCDTVVTLGCLGAPNPKLYSLFDACVRALGVSHCLGSTRWHGTRTTHVLHRTQKSQEK